VFTLSLYAKGDQELLSRAQNYLKSSNKTDQVHAYNEYKNLYLRAMDNNNKALSLDALDGIVKSGKKLKIDVAQYERELQKASKPKVVAQKVEQKNQKIKSSNQESKKAYVSSTFKIKSIQWRGSTLLLNFDRDLLPKQVNYFTIHEPKKNRYRYIFDIGSSMLAEAHNLHKNGIDRIKISQFDQSKIRLVIEHSNKIDLSYKSDGSTLVINTNVKELSKVQNTPSASLPAKYTQERYKSIDRHKTIVIDPGHGGKDPGAVGYKKYREKVIVLDVSKRLKKILESRGYRVHLTRENDRFLTLRERTVYANKRHADLFVSVHANAVEKNNAKNVHGIESYFLDKSRSNSAKNVAAKENSADLSGLNFYAKESFLNTLSSHNIIASNKLAIDLQGGMLTSLRKSYNNIKDGGVRPAPFWVLVGAQMPSVLVEIGFISHPMEAERLVDGNYKEKLALGLANGIENYFRNN